MKVLIVSKYDLNGGAAKAAYRLHKSLLNIGIDSYMLVQEKTSNDLRVICTHSKFSAVKSKIYNRIDSLPTRIYSKKAMFSIGWNPLSKIHKIINKLQPDIVHFHWVNHGMINIKNIHKIKSPII